MKDSMVVQKRPLKGEWDPLPAKSHLLKAWQPSRDLLFAVIFFTWTLRNNGLYPHSQMLNSNTGPNNIVPKQKIRRDLVDYSTKPVQRKMGLVVLTKKRTQRRVRLIVLKQKISRDSVGYLTKPAQRRMRLVVLNRKITELDLAGYLTNLIQKRIRTVALKQKIYWTTMKDMLKQDKHQVENIVWFFTFLVDGSTFFTDEFYFDKKKMKLKA